jgi:hypothetical protein
MQINKFIKNVHMCVCVRVSFDEKAIIKKDGGLRNQQESC